MKRIFAPLPFLSILVLVIVLVVLHHTISSNAAAPSITERATPIEPVTGTSALPLQQLALKPNYMLLQAGTAASSLVGEWRFDEASGTSAADSSGRSLNGTLQNGPVWTSGRYRSGLQFDGVNDYVQVGAQPALVMTNAMTISAWIYPTGTGAAGLGIIVNKEGEYEIARFYDGTIRWAFANSAPGWNFIDTGFVAPLNQWTHITLTYNNGEVKTYANGNLVHTYLGSGAIGDVGTSLNDFRIGGRQSAEQNFMGLIDEVSIYNQALTATDVTKLSQGTMLRNLALRKPATQSSTGWDSPASLAVDGNTDSDWFHGSVSHTDDNYQAWWQVDLGSVQQIDNVSVFLMTVCCSSHDNFDVKVSSDGSNWTSYYVAGPVDQVNVPVNRAARYVRVQLRGGGYLALGEVQVWGVPGTVMPGVVQAEDFDDGGEGISYHDFSAANEGGLYRSTAVDVASCVANDYVIGWNGSGEWTQYSINVLNSGKYTFQAVIGEESATGSLHVEIDGVDRSGPITIPATGSFCTLQTISKGGISLTPGQHRMRVVTDNVGVVLDSFRLVAEFGPYSGTPATIPGTIQVEAYDLGSEGMAYHDLSPSNESGSTFRAPTGVDVWETGIGYAQAGEWLLYTVNVATSGTYTVGASLGSPAAGGSIHIEVDGVDKIGPMAVPNTGGWGSYQTITKSGVQLSAGPHTIRLVLDTNSGNGYVANFDFLNFTLATSPPPNQPPKASAGASQASMVGYPVQFSSGGSYDPDGTITGYSWNFGDGQTASDANPTHVYSARGNYAVSLTVTDNVGATSTATVTVAVIEPTQSSYLNNSKAPGTIQAEDFDNGGPEVAYHDNSSGNQGGSYRPGENVDIEDNTASNTGYAVGWTQPGEWLNYVVQVGDADNYNFEAQVASPLDGGTGGVFHLEVDGGNVTGPITVPNTGGAWSTVSKSGIRLSAGPHVLRVIMESGGSTGYVGRFDYFRLTATQTPYGGTARALPGTIQAEDFDNGEQGTSYFDMTSGNQGGAYRSTDIDIWNSSEGPAVGWGQKGESLEYTVDVSQSNSYTFAARVASPGAGATFHLEVDEFVATMPIAVPATGSRDTWQTVQTSLKLTAGRHILRLVIDEAGAGGEVCINSFTVSIPPINPKTPPADEFVFGPETHTNVDYSAFGVGDLIHNGAHSDNGSFDLRSSKIKNVKLALLYWWGVPNGILNSGKIVFADKPIDGFGIAPSHRGEKYFGAESWSFVANVTTIVQQLGTIDYHITTTTCYGASLIILWDDGIASNNRDITIYSGNDGNRDFARPGWTDPAGWDSTLKDLDYTGRGAIVQLHVAEGERQQEALLTFSNGSRQITYPRPNGTFDPLFPDIFWGNSVPPNSLLPGRPPGGLWDIIDFDITSILSNGENDVLITAPKGPDTLFLVLAIVNQPHPFPTVNITDNRPDTNNRISGDLALKVQQSLIGGRIYLQANGTTTGSKYHWDFTGPVTSVDGRDSRNVSFDTDDGNDQSDPKKTIYTVTAKVTFTNDANEKAESTVTINVRVPTLPVYSGAPGTLTVEVDKSTVEKNTFIIWQMGSSDPEHRQPAMTFNAEAQIPDGPYLSSLDKSFISFQQSINLMRRVRNLWGKESCKTTRSPQSTPENVISSGWRLDGDLFVDRVNRFPGATKHFAQSATVSNLSNTRSLGINFKEGVEGIRFHNIHPENNNEIADFGDDLGTNLIDVDAAQVDDRFETSVMYTAGNYSRPLGTLKWQWGGEMVFDTTRQGDPYSLIPTIGPVDNPVSKYYVFNKNTTKAETEHEVSKTVLGTLAINSSQIPWEQCPEGFGKPQPTGIARDLHNIIENQHGFVQLLYREALGRSPFAQDFFSLSGPSKDRIGYHFWASKMTKNGFNDNAIDGERVHTAMAFIFATDLAIKYKDDENLKGLAAPHHTPEFNKAFVWACYKVLLQRNPGEPGPFTPRDIDKFEDMDGYNMWVNNIPILDAQGVSEDYAYFETAHAFLESIEYKARITANFTNFMDDISDQFDSLIPDFANPPQ